MKKFLVPVTWTKRTFVEIEADNIEEAMHEACGVDVDMTYDGEYVDDSFTVEEEGIFEVPAKGDA